MQASKPPPSPSTATSTPPPPANPPQPPAPSLSAPPPPAGKFLPKKQTVPEQETTPEKATEQDTSAPEKAISTPDLVRSVSQGSARHAHAGKSPLGAPNDSLLGTEELKRLLDEERSLSTFLSLPASPSLPHSLISFQVEIRRSNTRKC
jgi:hypothetical protein